MPIIALSIIFYLFSAFLIGRYYTSKESNQQFSNLISILLLGAIIFHAFQFSDYWTSNGVSFGLAHSASFVAWIIATLLFLASFSKPIHALGIIVYPIVSIVLSLTVLFPDSVDKVVSLSIASHVFLSISAYALLTLAVCQSILLKIQENQLHQKKINNFINKLAPLQTMESFLFQTIRLGFYLLTFSLITGFVFIEDIFSQHLVHKTVLSILAWIIFASLVIGHKIFGWRGKQTIISTQIGFGILLLAYFGSKFVLERLIA